MKEQLISNIVRTLNLCQETRTYGLNFQQNCHALKNGKKIKSIWTNNKTIFQKIITTAFSGNIVVYARSRLITCGTYF